MKNKMGQKLDLGTLWSGTAYPFRPSALLDLRDQKAHDVYCERMFAATERGATDEEMATIDAKDVKLTVWDWVEDWLLSYHLPSFIAAVYHFFADEPDYSAIRPF